MATPVDQKLLRQTKFPQEFNVKVDMQKVNVEVMKKWIARRLSEILGSEDDVVIELCFNLLEGSRFPSIKELQIQLTGFLDRDTPKFCKELWNLCVSAQSNPQGVPKELLEAKKQELMQEKAEMQKAAEVAQKQKETNAARDQDLDALRRRERNERSERGRGFGQRGGRGGRGGRDFENRRQPRSKSRSPSPRRRRSPYRVAPRREIDTYVPRGSIRAQRRDDRRGRSPSRSQSASSYSRSGPGHRKSSSRSPPRKQRRHGSKDRNGNREDASDDEGGTQLRRRRAPRNSSSSIGSRSPSPRPSRDRRRRYSPSRSPSPKLDRKQRRNRSLSSSSEDTRHDRRRGDARSGVPTRKRRPTSSPDTYRGNKRADIVRPRTQRDTARLSRSRSRSPTPASPVRRRRRNTNHSDSRSGSSSRSRSRSRSRDQRRQKENKRRRSITRYEPRHRRNTSSPDVSSPEPEREREPKRHKRDPSVSSQSAASEVNDRGEQ